MKRADQLTLTQAYQEATEIVEEWQDMCVALLNLKQRCATLKVHCKSGLEYDREKKVWKGFLESVESVEAQVGSLGRQLVVPGYPAEPDEMIDVEAMPLE